jgi:hypothetical protein
MCNSVTAVLWGLFTFEVVASFSDLLYRVAFFVTFQVNEDRLHILDYFVTAS